MVVTAYSAIAGKGDKTLIEQIEESDSIPVFLVLGKSKLAAYPTTYQVQLNVFEKKKEIVQGIVPKKVDSLQPSIVDLLNSKFETTKFYASEVGTKEELLAIVKQSKPAFFVYAAFTVDYSYYGAPASRDSENKLITNQQMWMRASVNFYNYRDDVYALDRISGTTGGRYKLITVTGYTPNVNSLMRIHSPLKLTNEVFLNLAYKVGEYSEKQKKKHAKIIAKRKK